MKLEHLATYLPYNLTIRYGDRTIKMNCGTGSSKYWIGITAILQRQKGFEGIPKPILRPLSDLTKEITHNGETFVPLKRLFELYESNEFSGRGEWQAPESRVFECRGLYQVRYDVNYQFGIHVNSFSYDPKLRRFINRDETEEKPKATAYQIDLFQTLFEWHFDVFGLIESGEAIDINTLKS